jgi:hypothetical protein
MEEIPPGFYALTRVEVNMSFSEKRELSPKALRIDTRMAKHLEKLSGFTSRSQNELITTAIKRYLYDNRKLFAGDIVDTYLIQPMEKAILVMKEEWHSEFGAVTVDVTRTEDRNVYSTKIDIKNKFNEVIYDDDRIIDITGDDWDVFKNFLINNIMMYIDFDDARLNAYFEDMFNYD